MSNLKYLTVPELLKARQDCERYIKSLLDHANGQKERLKWIDIYLTNHSRKVSQNDTMGE